MSYLEDYTPEDKEYESKRELENKAAENLLSDIPEVIEDEFRDIFREFQEEKTELARFCRECDKTETLLQAYIYSVQQDENHLKEFLDFYEEKFETETGKEVLQKMKEKSQKLSEDSD